jgi:hypothetical protein
MKMAETSRAASVMYVCVYACMSGNGESPCGVGDRISWQPATAGLAARSRRSERNPEFGSALVKFCSRATRLLSHPLSRQMAPTVIVCVGMAGILHHKEANDADWLTVMGHRLGQDNIYAAAECPLAHASYSAICPQPRSCSDACPLRDKHRHKRLNKL